jgi:undecaprenyl-diphosphatase
VALSTFVLVWVASEALLTWLKIFFHRGRPPDPLVETNGFSFPSGHAVAGAALAVALVLVFFPPGPQRRKWELLAIAFTFVMALSRVYLSAHWFSDVMTGVLLGTGIAIGSAALVTEMTNALSARGVIRRPQTPPGDPLDPRLS